MVCPRCIKVVKEEVERLNLQINSIKLGEVRLSIPPTKHQYQELEKSLTENGFELLSDKKSRIVDQIKTELILLIQKDLIAIQKEKLSDFLSQKIGAEYSSLSNLFSSTEGITIEKYFILLKIEKAKELLIYDELTISEIAYKLGYSSSQHLAGQFKKVPGLTPSHFKNIKDKKRSSLDEL